METETPVETFTDQTPAAPMNPAISFRVLPKRIGRHLDPEPFDVELPEHYRTTADYLASRIHRYAKGFLMSDNFTVTVDMKKGTWAIDGKRFGGGTFEEIDYA